MTLRDCVYAILTGTFAVGPAVFLACEHSPHFRKRSPTRKRWVVAMASGRLGVTAWSLARWLGDVEAPPAYSPEYVTNGIWFYGILVGSSAFASAAVGL